MISFFRISSLYKYFFLFLLLLAFYLPVFVYGLPLLREELLRMLIGERLHQGYFLYVDVWDDISPLAAGVYWLLDLLVGKARWVYQLLAMALVFVQALMLNQLFLRREVYQDLTMLPALIYVVLMCSFMDFYTLSPALMANTLLIWVINLIFSEVSEKRRGKSYVEIGIYLGVATLLYLPALLLLLVPVIVFFLYTPTKLVGYISMSFAFVFSILVMFLVFYMSDREYELYLNYFHPLFYLSPRLLMEVKDLFLLFVGHLLLLFLAIRRLYGPSRYTNYQLRCQNVMILWWVVSVLAAFLGSSISPSTWIMAIPASSFLISHYFLLLRSTLAKELVFTLFLFSVLFFSYNSSVHFADGQAWVNPNELVTQPSVSADLAQDKKLFITGNNPGDYFYGSAATPYLNWRLAKRHFESLDKYNVLVNIQENFTQNPPQLIIDHAKVMPRVFDKLPLLAAQYQANPKQRHIYHLQNNKQQK
jgi:hypothetical protein